MKFKSGFAWVKVNGYSYMCKIIKRDSESNTYVIELDHIVFWDVPEKELQPIRGDEEEET